MFLIKSRRNHTGHRMRQTDCWFFAEPLWPRLLSTHLEKLKDMGLASFSFGLPSKEGYPPMGKVGKPMDCAKIGPSHNWGAENVDYNVRLEGFTCVLLKGKRRTIWLAGKQKVLLIQGPAWCCLLQLYYIYVVRLDHCVLISEYWHVSKLYLSKQGFQKGYRPKNTHTHTHTQYGTLKKGSQKDTHHGARDFETRSVGPCVIFLLPCPTGRRSIPPSASDFSFGTLWWP